jgi:hypothetical protein
MTSMGSQRPSLEQLAAALNHEDLFERSSDGRMRLVGTQAALVRRMGITSGAWSNRRDALVGLGVVTFSGTDIWVNSDEIRRLLAGGEKRLLPQGAYFGALALYSRARGRRARLEPVYVACETCGADAGIPCPPHCQARDARRYDIEELNYDCADCGVGAGHVCEAANHHRASHFHPSRVETAGQDPMRHTTETGL